jgi:cyanophycin synthetase
MRILDRSVYVGPSLYAHFPGHQARTRPGRARGNGRPAGSAPFVDGLAAALPGLAEHGCSYASPAASSAACARTRARGSATCSSTSPSSCRTSPARTSLSARRAAPTPRASTPSSTNTAARRRHRGGRTRVAPAVRAAARGPAPRGQRSRRLELARSARRVHPLRAAPRAGSVHRLARARGRRRGHSLVATQRPVARAARPRPLPAAHPGDRHGRTPHIAVELASDKEETNKILSTLGLPVPKQELVQSEAQAARAARRIGFPVVTKPYNGNHGRGISIKLTTEEEVVQGFRVARSIRAR